MYGALTEAVSVRALGDRVTFGWQSCFGRCTQGPNVLVREIAESPGERRFAFATVGPRRGRAALYNRVGPQDASELIDEHIVRGRVVRRLIERPVRTQSRPTDGES